MPELRATDNMGFMLPEDTVITTHLESKCFNDDACCLHNPSDHPLNDAPMVLRFDKYTLIERSCEHDVLHPDPDSLEYLMRSGVLPFGEEIVALHGCDGCCTP